MFYLIFALFRDLERACLEIYKRFQHLDLTTFLNFKDGLGLIIFIVVWGYLWTRWLAIVRNNLKRCAACLNGNVLWNQSSFLSGIFISILALCCLIFILSLYLYFYIPHDLADDDDWFGADEFDELFPNGPGHGDTQNVHDSTVTKYVIDAVKKLGELKSPTTQIFADVVEYARQSTDPKGPKALDALLNILENNGFHQATKKTEMEIVGLVWQRIHEPVNQAHVDDLRQMLIQELADIQNVCLVGRISRILQTLESLDAENIVNLKPTWAINEEITQYCATYINKLTKKVAPEYRTAIDTLDRTPEQEEMARQFYACIKDNLQKRFRISYIETNILTQEKLDKITKPLFEELA